MTFKDWHHWFQSNQNHFSKMEWLEAEELTETERKCIMTSLQQFQRGENSEGKSLYRYAKNFDREEYLQAIRLFIKEEQTHAMVLGKFMVLNNIPKIKGHWVDSVFRKLRVLASLENSVTVLVTAEIIAAVYYKALRDATNSVNLKNICNQILADEEMHINFQSYTLRLFYKKKGGFGKWFYRCKHKTLMLGTTFVVWMYHKKVLKAGGYSYSQFRHEIMNEFYRAQNMTTGRNEIPMRTQYKPEFIFQ